MMPSQPAHHSQSQQLRLDTLRLRNREIVAVVLLGIFTLGIYPLYWKMVTAREAQEALGRPVRRGIYVAEIIAYAFFWACMIVYIAITVMTAFSASGDEEAALAPLLLSVGLYLGGILVYMVVSVIALWKIAHLIADVSRAAGHEPTVPPALHLIVIAVNVWGIVAMALLQSDLNKARLPPSQPLMAPPTRPTWHE